MQALTWDFGGYNDWYIPSFSELELAVGFWLFV